MKLRARMKHTEAAARAAAREAARAELLVTEEAGYLEAEGPMERTYRYKQADLLGAVDMGVARKAVNLELDTYGPYTARYARNGRHMVLGGAKGHLAIIDWNTNKLLSEFHVRENVRDVTFLHNQTLFAVAQRKYAFIYDSTGLEVHCLRSHIEPLALEFLPYHFLLASIGTPGYLKYQDVSTGALVAEHRTRLGACSVLRQNPWNAVLAAGHSNGAVTMWTPNMSTPVVKMATHRGAVTAAAIDAGGRYMVTAGADARVKVWDIRKFGDEPVFNYFSPLPATSLDVSQRGLVAAGFGSHVAVWGRDFGLEKSSTKVTAPLHVDVTSRMFGGGGGGGGRAAADAAAAPAAGGAGRHVKFDDDDDAAEHADGGDDSDSGDEGGDAGGAPAGRRVRRYEAAAPPRGTSKASAPYMRHELPGRRITVVRFRPFDDVLAVGHDGGLSTLLVPGAGEPNYDSREADPFQTAKARKEAEVHALLDKLPPTSISLDPTDVGRVDRAAPATRASEAAAEEAARRARAAPTKDKTKTRGRSKSERRRLKRNANVITAERTALLEKRALERAAARTAAVAAAAAEPPPGERSALSRFYATKPRN